MGLNKSKGNMYDFITHTWNTIKGECPHGCSYCYMKRWGKQNKLRFDEKELKTDLGNDNFIFVGSSCDMWAKEIDDNWIGQTLYYMDNYRNNKYFFQTKNPNRILFWAMPRNSVICTTIETNRFHLYMGNTPPVHQRASAMNAISDYLDTYVTIEPIMNFDLISMIELIKDCRPLQVNIGADSGNNNLPEPPKEKILELIAELEKFTIVKQKKNLKRLLK